MADAAVYMRAGESRPVFGEAVAPDGTITLSAATVTLRDGAGLAVVGMDGVDADGFDATALANPEAWISVDSTALALDPGTYWAVFALTGSGEDGLPRTWEPVVRVDVELPTAFPAAADVYNLLVSAGIPTPSTLDLSFALIAAQSEFHRALRRSYTPTADDATKRRDGGNREWLYLPAFQAITKIERITTDGTVIETIEPATYLPYPEDGPPYFAMRRVDAGDLTWGDPALLYYYDYPPDTYKHSRFRRAFWPLGAQNLRLTGTWADGLVEPPAVTQAILMLAAMNTAAHAVGQVSGGLVGWSEQGISEERFSERPFKNVLDAWAATIARALKYYKRRFPVMAIRDTF